ncbi:carbonic anhydrase [Rubritalea squalenifaciens]|uniref:carbonic anhydrase n=1 Tax=Rubritalea squalenifaciens TaxID=407226 RepID=UPI0011613BCE|nr:carbonic anhydrase [Rubritalea squalenifaciens]
MDSIKRLLENNKLWAADITAKDHGYFERLAEGQTPEYLWIGCADSRVPANQLLGLDPGEVFVHRNVANLVVHSDFNSLAVIHYAVEYLKVKHIIVCGHYGCGGVMASMDGHRYGLVDSWIRHIDDVSFRHREELERLEGENKVNRLCELNAIEQARHVAVSPPVIDAWQRGQGLHIHSFIYDLRDGLLRPLEVIKGPQGF